MTPDENMNVHKEAKDTVNGGIVDKWEMFISC